jgi:hypothetical protein
MTFHGLISPRSFVEIEGIGQPLRFTRDRLFELNPAAHTPAVLMAEAE